MLKNEWIEKAAEKAGISKRQMKICFDALEEEFMTALNNGEEIKLAGFGIFQLKERTSKSLRNPKTNVLLPAQKVTSVSFSVSNTLKDTLSNK